MFNLYDYLALRGARALSDGEAEAFGIELTSGWLKKHGKDELSKITVVQALLWGSKSKSNDRDKLKEIAEGLLNGKEFTDYIEVTGEDRHKKKVKLPKPKPVKEVKPSKIRSKLSSFVGVRGMDDHTVAIIASDKLGVNVDWSQGVDVVMQNLHTAMKDSGMSRPVLPDIKKTPDDEFFRSQAWKSLRYNAFSKYGNFCQCCGVKAGNGVVLHVDHIKPRSLYPELEYDINNLQILCGDCNVGKLHVKEDDWRE